MMEVHDNLPEHDAEGISKLTEMVEGVVRTLNTMTQNPIASNVSSSATKSATAVAEVMSSANAIEASSLTRQGAKEGPVDTIKRQVFMVTGHIFVFLAGLFVMAYPFRVSSWRRMLGFPKPA